MYRLGLVYLTRCQLVYMPILARVNWHNNIIPVLLLRLIFGSQSYLPLIVYSDDSVRNVVVCIKLLWY